MRRWIYVLMVIFLSCNDESSIEGQMGSQLYSVSFWANSTTLGTKGDIVIYLDEKYTAAITEAEDIQPSNCSSPKFPIQKITGGQHKVEIQYSNGFQNRVISIEVKASSACQFFQIH